MHVELMRVNKGHLETCSKWVASGLVVKALDCGLKRSGVPVPLVAEIYFSFGSTTRIE